MATKEERLAELKQAAKEWHDKRRQTLEDQVTLSKRILQGRTGSERLANDMVNTSTDLVLEEIGEFLGQ